MMRPVQGGRNILNVGNETIIAANWGVCIKLVVFLRIPATCQSRKQGRLIQMICYLMINEMYQTILGSVHLNFIMENPHNIQCRQGCLFEILVYFQMVTLRISVNRG